MNLLLKKLLSPRQTEYFIVNENFIIQETSAAVQRFADLHGGQIEFSSGTGLGTTFIVTIPFDKQTEID
ncbi:MAG: hypothetical protein WBL95_04065 [Microcoleus sp.]